jgi:flavin reductase (DIM6/NTAB) family NADH-FMN oxidoreductase RutF
VPLLAGSLASFACRLERIVEAGERDVVVGEVERLSEAPAEAGEPLVWFAGAYRRVAPLPDAG